MSVTFRSATFALAHSEPGELPMRNKIVEFPGTNGEEVLPMGKGGRDISVAAVSSSVGIRGTLEALLDGQTGTLVIEGDSYGNVELVGVGPFRFVTAVPDGLRVYYTAKFRQHLPD